MNIQATEFPIRLRAVGLMLLILCVCCTRELEVDSSMESAYAALWIANQNPALPVSDETLWLRADTNITTDASDFVSGWGAISSIALHAGVMTSAKPVLINDFLNGQPVLHFGGSAIMSTAPIELGQFTYIGVQRVESSSANAPVVEHGTDTNSANGFYIAPIDTCGFLIRRAVGSSGFAMPPNWGKDNQFHIFVLRHGVMHATDTFFLDGTQQTGLSDCVGGSDLGNGAAIGALHIGGRGSSLIAMTGYFAELIVYPWALSDQDVRLVVDYLSSRYNIAVSYNF